MMSADQENTQVSAYSDGFKSRGVSGPKPAPLPETRAGLEADRKTVFRSLNDYVDDAHCELWEQDLVYRGYHEAIWDSDTVEGSIPADNHAAAAHLREWVRSDPGLTVRFPQIARARLAAIVRSLSVVMRRLHKSRAERRASVHGEHVAGANGSEGGE